MWSYQHPTEIVFGQGELKNIGNYLERYNVQNALLIATNSIVKSGVANNLVANSNGKIAEVISGIEPNPTVENVEMCAKKAMELNVDYIIAIGGGSVIDCAKAVCAVVAENCTVFDLLEGKEITQALPLIAIPTVSGASSEVSGATVISWKEKQLKIARASQYLFPKLALIDPTLTYSCPKQVTAISGIDIIAHSLDSLGSIGSNPLTEHFATEAARLAFNNLLLAVEGNAEEKQQAKNELAYAAVLAGLAFSQTGTTSSHACSYILTAKYNIPHAEACAFTLDEWFLYNVSHKPLLDKHAERIGFENARHLVESLQQLKRKLGFRTTLSEINVTINDLDEIAESAYSAGNMKNNIAPVTKEAIKQIFLLKE